MNFCTLSCIFLCFGRFLHVFACFFMFFSSWGALGTLLGALGTLLGRSWGTLGCSWELLGRSWSALGALLSALGTLLGKYTIKNKKKPFLKAQLGALNPPKLAQKSFKNRCKKNIGFKAFFLLFLHLSRTSRKSSNLEFCRSCRCFTRFFKGWRLTLKLLEK